MKSFIIPALTLLGLTALCTALPEGAYLRRADELSSDDMSNLSDLIVTNDALPGQTFYGTAESIYNQINAIDPTILASQNSTSAALETRQGGPTSINCNWGAWVPQWFNCMEGQDYLNRLGDSLCGVNPHPACARVSCSHSCGMFFCNKLNIPLRTRCGDIPRDIWEVALACEDTFGRVKGAKDYGGHFIALGHNSC